MDKRIKNIWKGSNNHKNLNIKIKIKSIFVVIFILLDIQMISIIAEETQDDISWNSESNYMRMLENDINDGDYNSLYNTLVLYDCYGSQYDDFWEVAESYNNVCCWTMYSKAVQETTDVDKKSEYIKKTEEMKQNVIDAVDKYSDNKYKRVLQLFAEDVK